MNPLDQLSELESNGYLQLVGSQPELVFRFRHSLLQEAAYKSILKADRQVIHLAIAEAMETLYAQQLDLYAPLLAKHFSEADEGMRALEYYTLAAQTASKQFATLEALDHYTSAIDISQRMQLPKAKLLSARGKIYEILGQFELAKHDMDAALEDAHQCGDSSLELETLLNLGFAWTSRDYSRAGRYYKLALELARQMNDPLSLALSLSRLGNWHTNLDQPQEAIPYLLEALGIFQEIGDKDRIAETLDLLGMNALLDGDVVKGQDFTEQALEHFRKSNNLTGLASNLTTLGIANSYYECGVIHLEYLNFQGASAMVEEALDICKRIKWRSGEAYTRMVMSQIYAVHGDYQGAIDIAKTSIQLATDIGHVQWITASTLVLGLIYKELFAFNDAHDLLLTSYEHARKSGSVNWICTTAAEYSANLILLGELEQAEDVLNSNLDHQSPARTLGQRHIWCTRAKVAIARNDPQAALQIVEHLDASANNRWTHPVAIYVDLIRGGALEALNHWSQAEQHYRNVLELSRESQFPWIRWRCHAALSRLYADQDMVGNATQETIQAQRIMDQLSENVPVGRLQDEFKRRTRDILFRRVDSWQNLLF